MKGLKNVYVPPYLNWSVFCWISVSMVFLGLNDLSGLLGNENSSQQLQNHNACNYKILLKYYRNFNWNGLNIFNDNLLWLFSCILFWAVVDLLYFIQTDNSYMSKDQHGSSSESEDEALGKYHEALSRTQSSRLPVVDGRQQKNYIWETRQKYSPLSAEYDGYSSEASIDEGKSDLKAFLLFQISELCSG